MSVTSYIPPCKYRLDKLEKVLYLLDASIVKNIRIDNGEAYVDVDGDVAALQCHSLELSDSASLDERYEFEHQLAFSVDGYFNELKDFDGYFAVKSVDGVYWLINPNIKCKVTYTYTLDGKGQQTDYAVATVSNFPVLRLHGVEGSTPVSCGYNHCIFQTLQVNDKRYAKKDRNVIKYTNAGGFRTINYNKNSASFIEEFDGNQVHHTLSFNINFDDYKSSWHINLLEFVNNKYVGIIKTQCGNVLLGFGNGLQSRFEVSANDENGNPDSILIELNDVGTFLDYYDQVDFVYDSNTSWIFSYEHDGYECVSVNTARYLLKKEIDAFGNETGEWMCLDGYEEMFPDLDIVDVFEETETFGNLNCGGQVCFLKGGLPSNLVITEQGYWHDSFIFNSDTNWNITTDSEYVSVTPNSGTGLVTYVLRVLNTKEPTNVPYNATLTLHFCDNKTIDYHVTVKKGLSCLQNDTYNINASRQYVTIPTRCCIMQINSGDLAVTAQENDYFAVYVPQNNAGSAVTYNISVVFCDGHTEDVMIEQTKIYERWVSEGYQCFDGQKCLVERKYTGLTPSNINAPTDVTRTSDCALSNDCSGVITKWVDVIGAIQAICDHGVKYRLEEEMISFDGGVTWESNGKRRIGLPTEDSPANCAQIETWDVILNQYFCEGTTKWTKESLSINGEPQNVYRKGSEIIASASTDCGYFVPPSGSHMLTEPRETDDYVCDGYSRYIKMRWWKSYDSGNTWTSTDIYSKGALLEQFSTACGYGGDVETRWRAYTAETMCIDTNLYYMYIKEESTDGGSTWHVAIPTTLSIDGEGTEPLNLAESASTQCGYEPVIEPIYEWREVEGEYICDECETPPPPTPSYSGQYLTFIAREAGTFSFSNAMSYSLDSGTTWTTLEGGASTPTIQSGETVMWKGNSRPYQGGGIGTFSSTGAYDVEGNAMSLLFGDDFEGQTSLVGKDYAFQTLFWACGKLISAENLVLPATTLAQSCYDSMFIQCSGLTTVPSDLLPATNLADRCYIQMFDSCTSLTTVPQLPATTLTLGCYYAMFVGCSSITTAPQLLATTLATSCYNQMFNGCTSLTTAPELPATTLAERCYEYMFASCESLTTAPQLLATTLATRCYYAMFNGCISLSAITCLATDISATDCTKSWVRNVASTGVFTKDASMNDWTIDSTSGVPIGWTVQDYQEHDYSQDYLTFRAREAGTFSIVNSYSNTKSYSLDSGVTWTNLSDSASTPTIASGQTIMWKGRVNSTTTQVFGIGKFSSTGQFDVEGNIMSLLYGDNFSGQTSLSGYNYLFYNLFSGCTNLVSAENLVLPATTLTYWCYNRMFQRCTSLTTTPILSAATLTDGCYDRMFRYCQSLNSITCLATDISASNCTNSWVEGVSSTGTFTKAAGMNDWPRGDSGIPTNWTVQDAT